HPQQDQARSHGQGDGAADGECPGENEIAFNGRPFAELAKANSRDKATAHKGGDLAWIQKGVMEQRFSDFFSEATGLVPSVS
ncbi:MAG: peptidylprolyl isomerase, partial [Desulfobacteraceae bacterium]